MPLNLTRSIMVVLLPGFVVALPIIIAVIQFSEVESILHRAPQISLAIAFAVAVLIGSILETISSRIEVSLDRKMENELNVRSYWFDYLAYDKGTEPVGFRYVSRLATTMYFELSMACATILSGVLTMLYIFATTKLQSCYIYLMLTGLILILSYTLYKNGCDTHLTLCVARKEIMSRLTAKPE